MDSAATIAAPNERNSGIEARPALGTMLLRPTSFRFFCVRTFTAALRTSRLNRRVHIWIAAVVVVVSIGESAAQPKSGEIADQPKQILFLHSFGPNFQQGTAWSREIQNELNRQSLWPLNIQEYSLVRGRNGDNAAEAKFVEYLNALYVQRRPDLIVAIGAPAARFVQQNRADLFPTTPMLLATLDMRRVEPSMLSEQDAVVAMRFNQVALVQDILRLLPETRVIALIIGNSPFERYLADEQRRLLGPLLENKAELIFYNERPFSEILKEVANLPLNSAILFLALSVDGAGAVYGDKEALKRIYEVANAPIFSYSETYFTGEVVGGPMFSALEGARPTAAVAVRMLEGEKGSDIKVPPIEFSAPKYDWRQLQRWTIRESVLPLGSAILFREPTIWQRYSWQIALITAVILAQAGFIFALLHANRRRQFAEVRRQFAEAQSRDRLTELARVVRFSTAGELTASIAHEINQPLGAILTNAETAQEMLKSSSPDIAELNEIVGDILRDDRRASEIILSMKSLLGKTPFELKSIDLNDLVRDTVALLTTVDVARNVKLVSLINSDALPILGDRIQLQQVILNLVVNGIDAMKDTPRDNRVISIRTSRAEKFAELSVSDRGSGLPEDKLKKIFESFFTSKAGGMGMGLSIARTIIEAHHGLIWANNRDHGGASFSIKLPISNNGAGPS